MIQQFLIYTRNVLNMSAVLGSGLLDPVLTLNSSTERNLDNLWKKTDASLIVCSDVGYTV